MSADALPKLTSAAAAPPIRAHRCSSPRTRARAKPRCWSTASRGCCCGSKPSAFLCITYTKAAAAEMQRRLFERLGAWCVADDATLGGGTCAKLERRRSAILARARALFAQRAGNAGRAEDPNHPRVLRTPAGAVSARGGRAAGFDIADEPRAAALLMRARAPSAVLAAMMRRRRRSRASPRGCMARRWRR